MPVSESNIVAGARYGTERKRTETSIKSAFLRLSTEGVIPPRGVATTTLINGRFLAKPHGGVARVGCELLRALIEEIDQTEPELRLWLAAPPGVDLAGIAQSTRCPAGRGFAGRLGEQLGLPLAYPGATILSFCNVTPMLAWRSVVWIHDAHVFDAPETYPRPYRLWHRAILTAVRLRRFEVATVSNFARDRLIHHGIDPKRIRVVHNGGDHILREAADPSALARAGLAPKQYMLVVGSPARHKNVPFAVDALLAHTDPALKIAVLGLSQQGPYKSAERLSRDPRVVILPRVDDGQLRALYAAARSVVSPSLIAHRSRRDRLGRSRAARVVCSVEQTDPA